MAVIYSKIGIIGGGISGLAAAKQLSKHDPIVFEATDSIGGVWKHCSFRTTKLQTPRCDYQFSDYPWPQTHDDHNSTDRFPSYVEILDYLDSYANHFDLFKFINFNSKVTEIRFVGDQDTMAYQSLTSGKPVWEVAVRNTKSDTIQWYAFEFVVVCSGKYGDIPIIPKFPTKKGPQVFKGKVMHSQEYSKLSAQDSAQLVEGKKVVVVGYKKSAIDLAVECAEAKSGEEGKACTMVVRTLHWIVPHYSFGGLPFILNLFHQVLAVLPSTTESRHSQRPPLSPLLPRATSKIIESYLLWKLPLVKYGLKPDHPFEEDYASCQMAILPDKFFPHADMGNINFKKASNWWFWEGGVEFEDNTRLDADVVLLATGYDGKKKLKTMLPGPFRSFLEFPSSMLPLYRGTIHPLIPNMAFIGYVESVSNLHTSEMRCKWLARMLDDEFKLPSTEKMLEQITQEMDIMKTSTRFYKRSCISTFSINHTDEICKEMGWSCWRKKSWYLGSIYTERGRLAVIVRVSRRGIVGEFEAMELGFEL
ncbi:probable flavin-containing monooxygenase 1, partial [Tanacetum coccineum]